MSVKVLLPFSCPKLSSLKMNLIKNFKDLLQYAVVYLRLMRAAANIGLIALLFLLSGSSKPDMSDSAAVLEAFKFIESAAAEFSDEDEDEEEGREKNVLDLAAVRQDPITVHLHFTPDQPPDTHHMAPRW